MATLIFCVFDEKHKIHHNFRASQSPELDDGAFRFMEDPSCIAENSFLTDAFRLRESSSVVLSCGGGQRKYLYVLPYERKWGKWCFACVQVTTVPPNPDDVALSGGCALAEERVCLVLVDSRDTIRAASPRVPEAFGYESKNLIGLNLGDLFSGSDAEVLSGCSADTNESILSCTFFCLDGSKRDVEVKKFSAPDGFTLYGICDVSPRRSMEEFAEATARERRRIGQDLHDSIGQTLTGISLLSRSLSNVLNRDGHGGSTDASQISELADEASNQIRQISRSLMPSDIVQRGLCDALRELARITTASCNVVCEAFLDESLEFPDVAVETHLYRIAQESVNNAVRHAGASRIEIIVCEVDGLQQLEVVDNGRWKEPATNLAGIGLKTMEYRASAIGGLLHLGHGAQGGTRVTCRLELDEALALRE
ncbi:MAG: sensor histidine kinase [Kiritimatiellales bacterium]|nr:sensor histidine kinase [Kiritimatiellales bacterium]